MMPTVDLTAAPYPMRGLPLHRERLRDAIAAMGPNDQAAELVKLIRAMPPAMREVIRANLEE